ncbi:MAG: DUF1848 domain-containing protein [Ignavibacteriales bacterium]|nr:DUF1848 domain-containing protein [Ignavibacteriales bacterium]
MTKLVQQIISVSRRTDIPAYYADWFRERLERGYSFYPNPYSQKPVFINLLPEAVKAFVFWTRNPKPLFKHLDFIDEKYNNQHYMHFTINGLPIHLEQRNPNIDFAISSAEFLAKRYGDNYVQWRFDPIVFSSISSSKYLISMFSDIAKRLHGITKRCYFSFVDLYAKTERNFNKLTQESNILFYKTSLEEQIEFVNNINSIANKYEIKLYSCAEDQLLNKIDAIQKAHCVDADIIEDLCQKNKKVKFKYQPSRIGCGCIDSKDIGYYDSCPHGCIYCYANMNPEKALTNYRKYMKNGFPLDDMQNINLQGQIDFFTDP